MPRPLRVRNAAVNRVAVVDVGTNSVRLLVGEAADSGLRTVERIMTITRLGAGVDANGHLDDAALARTLECISGYARRWQELSAERVRIAATSAVRDAEDRQRFFDGVRDRTGVEAEVLAGDEEARTAFLGATGQLDAPAPYLVLDIGGGSTEFILGASEPSAVASRQLGCVRLTERCLASDPPTAVQMDAARAAVDRELDAVLAVMDPATAKTLVGVAGTVTTIAALHLRLDAYEPAAIHRTAVPAAEVAAITARLAGMTSGERARLGPMAPGREDVIVGGAVILQRAVERFGFTQVVASESDILDGLALQLLR